MKAVVIHQNPGDGDGAYLATYQSILAHPFSCVRSDVGMTSSAHRANALPSNINRFKVRQSQGGTQPLAAVLMALIYHGQVHEPWRLR